MVNDFYSDSVKLNLYNSYTAFSVILKIFNRSQKSFYYCLLSILTYGAIAITFLKSSRNVYNTINKLDMQCHRRNQMYKDEIIGIEKLFLDKKNYRIDFERYNTAEKVIDRLYAEEDIIGMIKGIVTFPGIYPHEKLIVIPREDGTGYTVKEGNRRILAIKSLLMMINPPGKYKREVVEFASKLSDETKESLQHIGCVVYDTDDKDYIKILADKHSSVSYQRWGQISQWHFFKDLFDINNRNIDFTANELAKSKSEISNYIRHYNLISYIRKLPYWDENDLRDEIENNNLEATRFSRPLGFNAVKEALNLRYDDFFEVQPPEKGIEKFNLILYKYALATLILDKNDEDYIDTRSTSTKVKSLIDRWITEFENYNGTEPKGKNTSTRDNDSKDDKYIPGTPGNTKTEKHKTTSTKKPEEYFEKLTCSVDSQRLKRLTCELRNLSKKSKIDEFACSALILTRTLMEAALLYQVERKGMFKAYEDWKKQEHGLKNLTSYVIDNTEFIFDRSNARDAKSTLNLFLRDDLPYLNKIVHGRWVDPTVGHVHETAGHIRELLRAILNGTA